MQLDPTSMRPAEVVRLLNSTPLGEVLSEQRLRKHRSKAGYRIGDGSTVHLLKYVAWLHGEYADRTGAVSYAERKSQIAAREAQRSRDARDIASDMPECVNPERRESCRTSFRRWCEVYFPGLFTLAWSEDHLIAIRKMESAVLYGGLFAHAMPRGSGKTTLAEVLCLWAILYGHRRFVCLIAASSTKAKVLLDNMKTWCETNELLYQDFPEVFHAIRKLGRISNRQAGQIYNGEPTRIEWNADKIVIPTIPGSEVSGSIISTAGMKGSDIRGQQHALADGVMLRPDLAVIDDPQTKESALSVIECEKRESIISADVLGMAGPGQKIAAVMPCTVIREGDLADRMLDRRPEAHPQWQGERTKMVYEFPTDMALWDEYRGILTQEYANDGDMRLATAFYAEHRAEMDAGAKIAWEDRYNEDELSAIQHAMNLMFRDEAAFFAEYQNDPLPTDDVDEDELTKEEVLAKINGRPRYEVPLNCEYVTAFVDVQKRVLFYAVVAWEDNFTGYVIDYGTLPDQRRHFFTIRDIKKTIQNLAPDADLEGAVYAALEALTGVLMDREWRREDGAVCHIDRLLIDAGWQTDTVNLFCKQANNPVFAPSKGFAEKASQTPWEEYRRRPGDRVGMHWRMPATRGQANMIRTVHFDANFWKSFLSARWKVATGDKGCLSLFGTPDRLIRHTLFAEHATSEYRVRVEGRGRVVDEWQLRPGRSENHWLDCLVGCAVGASMEGAALEIAGSKLGNKKKQSRKPISLSQLRRKRLD